MAKIFFKVLYLEKKEEFLEEKEKKLNYQISDLYILNMILGNFTKRGKKSFSCFFLNNILFFLKKNKNLETPFFTLKSRLSTINPSILLFNSRRGTVIYELPRVLSIEQSLRKGIEWLIKLMKKRKKNTLNNIKKELENIALNRGEIITKNNQITFTAHKNKPFFYILKKRKTKLLIKKKNVRKTA